MLKEVEYQEKFELLKPWLVEIIQVIKKDLKQEHLKIDKAFCRRYFLGKNFSNVSVQEMTEAYSRDIESGNVGLAEFIASRWLLKNKDIYDFFEKRLTPIFEDFEALEHLSEAQSTPLLEGAIREFGFIKTYLFTVLNSVVFSEGLLKNLREQAIEETSQIQKKRGALQLEQSRELIERRHKREVLAICDRYDKKLSNLKKKYSRDIEELKELVEQLQKKLSQ